MKAALNCGFIIPYIIGFTKLLLNIRNMDAIKTSLGIEHPAVSRTTTKEIGPHVIRNTQRC